MYSLLIFAIQFYEKGRKLFASGLWVISSSKSLIRFIMNFLNRPAGRVNHIIK